MRRRTALATVASLVTMSAGCTSGSDSTEPDGDDGETTVDTELTEVLESFAFPEGTDRDGLDRDLASDHEDRLTAAGSFRATRRSERSGETTFTHSRTSTVDGSKQLLTYDDSGFMAPVDYWIDGDDVLVRSANDSGERYFVGERSRVPETETLAESRTLRALIDAATFEPSELDEREDGSVVVYESVDVNSLDPLGRVQYVSRYDELEASIDVSEAGIVGYRYELRGEGDDGPTAVTESATFDDVGETTLEEPEWVDEGREGALELSFEPADDSPSFVVTVERGGPIPAGVRIDFDTSQRLTGELDREITRDYALYLYSDSDELGVSVDSEPDSGSPLDRRSARLRIYTESGLLLYDGAFSAYVNR